MFYSGLDLGGHECLCATSQIRHLTRVSLFTINYCLFANGDVSISLNGKDDNAVLECVLSVSGNKVRVCYHLCRRHTTERAFVLHIISEIARSYFHIKEKCFSYISYHMRHIIITN